MPVKATEAVLTREMEAFAKRLNDNAVNDETAFDTMLERLGTQLSARYNVEIDSDGYALDGDNQVIWLGWQGRLDEVEGEGLPEKEKEDDEDDEDEEDEEEEDEDDLQLEFVISYDTDDNPNWNVGCNGFN